MLDHLFAVILAGGSGTRFWPASRRARPKQILPIGPTPDALIAATVRRIEALCPSDRILIATGIHLLEATRVTLPWLPDSAFLGEPVARNTAPCIAWATWDVLRRDPDALVMVLPSDHHIGDETAYRAAVERAVGAARQGAITTIGIEPERAETGCGYIEAGAELAKGVRAVARFVEKPDRARAQQYMASGRHFWNSGMFFFRADVMERAMRAHLPAVAAALDGVAKAAPAEAKRALARAFEGFPSISIDYAIMEKADNLAVVPASFAWSDLGSWQSAWELSDKDDQDNAIAADAILVDAARNLVRDLRTERSKKVIALVGVDDLCVIETDDALLVIRRDAAQDVKKVVEALAERGRHDLL